MPGLDGTGTTPPVPSCDGAMLGGVSDAQVLGVRLFGELTFVLPAGEIITVDPPHARSLLAYLILHQDAPQSRQRLAFLLWPDSTESQARTNLRHLLHTLRQAAPALFPHLEVNPGTVGWRPQIPCRIDVVAFERR